MGENLRDDLTDIATAVARAEGVTIPGLYPAVDPNDMPARPGEPEVQQPARPAHALAGWSVRYRRFDLQDDTDALELERVMARVIHADERERWVVAREEWVHDKDGGTYVVLKYLMPPPREPAEPAAKGEPPKR